MGQKEYDINWFKYKWLVVKVQTGSQMAKQKVECSGNYNQYF